MNDPFETPPELRNIEAMLTEAHPLGAGFDAEESRIAQDRIVFESGKVVGQQTSKSNWWKATTAIASSVATVLLVMQFGTVFTEPPSIELAGSAATTSKTREVSDRETPGGTPILQPLLAKHDFDDRSRMVYQETDFEDDEAYLKFLNLRFENVKRSTFNQEKDPS